MCCIFVIYYIIEYVYVFFFKQKTAYEMRISDWSSDVCSSDLVIAGPLARAPPYVWILKQMLHHPRQSNLKSTVLFEFLHSRCQFGLVVFGQFLAVFDTLDQSFVLGLQVIFKRFFEAQDLFDFKVVEVAVVACEQGKAKFPDQ